MNNSNTLPKGPTGNSFFQLIKFVRNPIAVFDKCKKMYGKTFTLRAFGHPDAVVISDPVHIKQVFSSNSDQLHTGERQPPRMKEELGLDERTTSERCADILIGLK